MKNPERIEPLLASNAALAASQGSQLARYCQVKEYACPTMVFEVEGDPASVFSEAAARISTMVPMENVRYDALMDDLHNKIEAFTGAMTSGNLALSISYQDHADDISDTLKDGETRQFWSYTVDGDILDTGIQGERSMDLTMFGNGRQVDDVAIFMNAARGRRQVRFGLHAKTARDQVQADNILSHANNFTDMSARVFNDNDGRFTPHVARSVTDITPVRQDTTSTSQHYTPQTTSLSQDTSAAPIPQPIRQEIYRAPEPIAPQAPTVVDIAPKRPTPEAIQPPRQIDTPALQQQRIETAFAPPPPVQPTVTVEAPRQDTYVAPQPVRQQEAPRNDFVAAPPPPPPPAPTPEPIRNDYSAQPAPPQKEAPPIAVEASKPPEAKVAEPPRPAEAIVVKQPDQPVQIVETPHVEAVREKVETAIVTSDAKPGDIATLVEAAKDVPRVEKPVPQQGGNDKVEQMVAQQPDTLQQTDLKVSEQSLQKAPEKNEVVSESSHVAEKAPEAKEIKSETSFAPPPAAQPIPIQREAAPTPAPTPEPYKAPEIQQPPRQQDAPQTVRPPEPIRTPDPTPSYQPPRHEEAFHQPRRAEPVEHRYTPQPQEDRRWGNKPQQQDTFVYRPREAAQPTSYAQPQQWGNNGGGQSYGNGYGSSTSFAPDNTPTKQFQAGCAGCVTKACGSCPIVGNMLKNMGAPAPR